VQALQACLDSGPIDLGFLGVTSIEAALGLLWGSPASFDTGEKRDQLEKARFILARQTLVGICNQRLFGSSPTPTDLLTQAVSALGGTNCSSMLSLASSVDAFNNSGDSVAFPAGFDPGAATPQTAASLADDPTAPTSETCSG
jgi:hypothetical protein